MMKERSRHRGVYHNNDTAQPYRVAIKTYTNGEGTYNNVGYFDLEDTAAWVYNVYALCAFGASAKINDVDVTDEIEEEVEQYARYTQGFKTLMREATRITETHGDKIRTNQDG
jgi:hypothetical protein